MDDCLIFGNLKNDVHIVQITGKVSIKLKFDTKLFLMASMQSDKQA